MHVYQHTLMRFIITYLIYSEEDDSVIGTQIMYFKKRSLETLKKYLPRFLFDTVEELKLEVE